MTSIFGRFVICKEGLDEGRYFVLSIGGYHWQTLLPLHPATLKRFLGSGNPGICHAREISSRLCFFLAVLFHLSILPEV